MYLDFPNNDFRLTTEAAKMDMSARETVTDFGVPQSTLTQTLPRQSNIQSKALPYCHSLVEKKRIC